MWPSSSHSRPFVSTSPTELGRFSVCAIYSGSLPLRPYDPAFRSSNESRGSNPTPFMPHKKELKNTPNEIQVPFHRDPVGEEEVRAVSGVIRSGWLTMGPKTFEFENEFAKYVGAQHAIAVSTGTAALHLSLEAAGVQAGDEVLLPTTTFTATAEAVTYVGARPVLVDIDPVTMNMYPEDSARRITLKTKEIIP